MSEQVNKHENHTPILTKNTCCATKILIKGGNYFSFPFICVFLYVFVILFYIVGTILLSL